MKMILTKVVLLVCVRVASAGPYQITDLGTLGGTHSYGSGINAAGQVVGYSDVGDGSNHAFVYSNGTMQDLGLGIAYGVNDSGQVVGVSQNQGFLYSNGSMNYFAFLGSGSVPSSANAINNNGQVVGQAMEYSVSARHAFLYSSGLTSDLGILGGAYNYAYGSGALGINDSGQIVGWSITANSPSHAFLYSGSMQDLGTLPGGAYSHANWINHTGQVVGVSGVAGGSHPFLYSNGLMLDLGTLGGNGGVASGINGNGQVVGDDYTSGGTQHAFLYSNGSMTDLNSLIDPASGWTLGSASAVNDSGQIVGYGINSFGQQHGFLLTPTPEPATLSLLCLGFLALQRRRH